MYEVVKTIEVSASHALNHLRYDSPCKSIHGHNWKITVYCSSESLNDDGMVVDFKDISDIVNRLDHKHINDVLVCVPTAEHIARWVCSMIKECYKVEVEESKGNKAIYSRGKA